MNWNELTGFFEVDKIDFQNKLESNNCYTISNVKSFLQEEREISWSWQHPSRTGRSMWKGCNYCSHDNQQQDLADRKMANPMDPVLSHHTSPALPNDQPISHPSKVMLKITLNRLKQQGEDHHWRTGNPIQFITQYTLAYDDVSSN